MADFIYNFVNAETNYCGKACKVWYVLRPKMCTNFVWIYDGMNLLRSWLQTIS